MVKYEPETQECAIVLVGNLNPAIFSPAWLALNKVITVEQSEAAEVEVVHNEIAKFAVAQTTYIVLPSRFQITTSSEPFFSIMDQVRYIFGEKLTHTPIASVGINYVFSFKMENLAKRTAWGRRLAPIEPWGEFGRRMNEGSEPENVGGMIRLSMFLPKRPRDDGYTQVDIRPEDTTGVRIEVNDHIAVSKAPSGATDAISSLHSKFESSISESRKIVEGLLTFAETVQ